ncbi:MAG TPA: transcription antitermination factor NusB [Hyphomicrobiaceae bacterium]|jgi:N utilization substance protein B|nr:transcription antitermination factor NusB [Hyphomicrobiaceae bacterium]
MTAARAKRDKGGDVARSQARLATVQALYQMDLAETDLVEVIEEFKQHRLGGSSDGDDMAEADEEHFAEVLRGVVKRQREIDPLIDQQLATGWRLARIDSIVRAILRAATFELIEMPDVPSRVVISEYIEVARAFFEGDEPKLVNGVLDQLARKLRPGTLPERG